MDPFNKTIVKCFTCVESVDFLCLISNECLPMIESLSIMQTVVRLSLLYPYRQTDRRIES